MSRSILGRFSLLAVVLALTLSAADRAWAVQYPTLDPNYTQEIFTGPLVGGPGMAWTTSNALLTRNGSTILAPDPPSVFDVPGVVGLSKPRR